MDALSRCEPKVATLLNGFLDPAFEVRNDLYLSTLLSHLSGKYDADLGERLLNLPLLTEWTIRACSFWENNGNPKPSQSASVFTLHLASLLSRDEKKFAYFKTFNVYNTLSTILRLKSPEAGPSVKLGYVKMLRALLEHRPGLDWLISTDNWRDVLNLSLEGQTKYIVREGMEFMVEMLKRSIEYNEIFCKLVVKQIVGKLQDNLVVNNYVVQEEVLRRRSEPVVKLISFILEDFLQNKEIEDYRIPDLFISVYSLETILWTLSEITQNVEFTSEIDKTILLVYFLQTAMIKSKIIPTKDLRAFGAKVIKLVNLKVTRGQHINVIKVCFHSSVYFNYLLHRIEFPTNELAIFRMENHLVPIELLPIIAVTFTNTTCSVAAMDFEIDDIRDEFISKIFKSMNEAVTRVAFAWKEQLMRYEDVFPLAIAVLRNIMNGRKTYGRSRAILVFQMCVYSFKDVTLFIKGNQFKNPDAFVQNPAYMISLINCLSTFINENNITWAESLETICVLSITVDFLNLNLWSPRVVVEALKLLNLSIAKYMSPNLALLSDNTDDSSLNQLGPLLRFKLHENTWEIRDSALEVVRTISIFSCTKFPPFQDVIKSADLINLVLMAAIEDSEGFVRASALKCLQEMIKVGDFWNPILLALDLPRKIIKILKSESEGIVRTEASCLMRCIYEYQAFPIDLMDQVYDSMYFAATHDLHWEVKIQALDFWGKVVFNHLQNQGMIDGSFPEVTFSKEHKKIITLTESEIKLRLHKVLHQLSNCGCLSVFVTSLQNDCDLEVLKKAVEKSNRIKALLTTYKIIPTNSINFPDSPLSLPGPLMTTTPPVTPRLDYSDEIIDRIVETDDLTLLKDVYNPTSYPIGVVTRESIDKRVSPEYFLRVIGTDLDAVVRSKTRWLRKLDDLESLLDDILRCYGTGGEVNSMDCY